MYNLISNALFFLQPGTSSQVVINEGIDEGDYFDEDAETRMAIPNEMEIRLCKRLLILELGR